MFVYIIINDVNGKIYIGKTKGSCLSRYLKQKIYDVQKGWNGTSYLYNAMKHHGVEHFHIHPLISTLTTNEDLCFWERVLIAQYDSQNPDIGYNICRGGEGFTGPHSPEARRKNSEASRRMWKQPGHKEAFSAKMTGHPVYGLDKIKAARAVQNESIRLAGWETNKGNAGNLSHEAHVLGGKAGSKENKRKAGLLGAANGGLKARHIRWHVNRRQKSQECPLCQL